jgi:hypothetical protein
MPHIAYYQVLTDNVTLPLPNFSPGAGESQNLQRVQWNPANDIKLDNDGSRWPLLCYQVDLEGAGNFTLRVQIRDPQGADRTISTFSFDGNTTRQFMDPFPSQWVGTGNNKIFFRRLSGTGSGGVIIRNVVVLYQRFID